MRTSLALLAAMAFACSPETTPGATVRAAGDPAAPDGAPSTSASAVPMASTGEAAQRSPAVLERPTDGGPAPAASATRVLHVGDSMAPLVGNYLRPLFTKTGRNYWIESAVSTSTLEWAQKRLLQDAMYKYDPEVVLISLGSNELFDPKPQRRASAVKQIVADTRGRACLWIGPPLWKKDTGFIEVLRQNLGHCRYFDSSKLDLPRMEDGRHPSWTGGWRWADAVWRELGGTEPVPTGSPLPKP